MVFVGKINGKTKGNIEVTGSSGSSRSAKMGSEEYIILNKGCSLNDLTTLEFGHPKFPD